MIEAQVSRVIRFHGMAAIRRKGETAEEVRSARDVASGMLQNMQQTVTESWSAISIGHNEFCMRKP